MQNKYNILTGNITSVLIKLALPIMGTSFLQMSYNLTDMIWIGKLGSGAVASIGTAGFFMWLSLSLIRMVQSGVEIKTAQNIGAGKFNIANQYIKSSLVMAIVLAILYTLFLFVANSSLIGFFDIKDLKVVEDAEKYLYIVGAGTIFAFLNPIISGFYNGAGKTTIPFRANIVGVTLNVLLDPILIFVCDLGIDGAAYATVLSQAIVTVLLVIELKYKAIPFPGFNLSERLNYKFIADILKLGGPIAFQSGLFTVFAILLGKIIAVFGPEAIAAQKVGIQVEAISYMTAHGFASALSAFVGQNYGAGNSKRVVGGVVKSAYIIGGFGFITSVILYIGAESIFKVFIDEPETLAIGISYLKILAYSQLFMCLEITLGGAFMGVGKTLYPAIMSIVFTGIRVPAAAFLSQNQYLGLDGIWWSISISSVFKGLIILFMLLFLIRRIRKKIGLEAINP